MFKVMEKRQLNQDVILMKIYAPLIANKAKAGQFIIFRVDEKGERIPLTIADHDKESGAVTIIFQTIGRSTKRLGMLNVGDFILDFVGPLGKETSFKNIKKACVIGGGVGCAIAYPQAKELFESVGADVDIIAGFRNKDIVILEDEMRKVSNNLIITTDDGSYSEKGFVTDLLQRQIDCGIKYDIVIAIGPLQMMKAVCKVTKPYSIQTMVSLNPIMIDGTGMCGGCRVTVDNKIKFACVDGPDFDGHLVNFDELIQRNNLYKKDESRSVDCVLMKPAKENCDA